MLVALALRFEVPQIVNVQLQKSVDVFRVGVQVLVVLRVYQPDLDGLQEMLVAVRATMNKWHKVWHLLT